MKFFCLTTIFFIQFSSFSQDFRFQWNVFPFGVASSSVTIIQKGSDRQILINECTNNDQVKSQIDKNDCDSILRILKNLNFRFQDNNLNKTIREYYKTRTYYDTTRVIIGQDTIRKGVLRGLGYFYDTDSNKYYRDIGGGVMWTDGNTYNGEFEINDTIKRYSVYCVMILPQEYQINRFIYKMILKYDLKHSHLILGQIINDDKPRQIR